MQLTGLGSGSSVVPTPKAKSVPKPKQKGDPKPKENHFADYFKSMQKVLDELPALKAS